MIKTGKLWTPVGLESLDWSRGIGTTEKGERYSAQSEIEALALYQELRGTSDRVRLQRKGDSPSFDIIAYRGGDPEEPEQETVVDTHELLGNVLQQPIALNAVLHEILTDAQINFVIQLANDFTRHKISVSEAYLAIDDSQDPEFAGTANGDARNLFDQIVQGQTSFTSFQWVYRRTVNVGSSGTFTLNAANVNLVYETTGAMLDGEGIELPDDFDLPDGQWLKLPPTQIKQYGQRTQVEYEFWWAEDWLELFYDRVA